MSLRVRERTRADSEEAMTWLLEIDVKEKLELILTGGILAPSHKRSARFSDVQLWGFLPQNRRALSCVFRPLRRCASSQTRRSQAVADAESLATWSLSDS